MKTTPRLKYIYIYTVFFTHEIGYKVSPTLMAIYKKIVFFTHEIGILVSRLARFSVDPYARVVLSHGWRDLTPIVITRLESWSVD
jgi:hypothetical protein